jgi:DUF1680 family protein
MWIDENVIVQGDHEADCGVVGYTVGYVTEIETRSRELETAFWAFIRDCELVNNHHNHAALVAAYRVLNKDK